MNVSKALGGVVSNLLDDIGAGQVKRTPDRRGLNVYTTSGLTGVAGIGKSGQIIRGAAEEPIFGLSLYDRLLIAQRCDAVFGVIAGRTNRIASLEWTVIKESKEEDRIAEYLKDCYSLWKEYGNTHRIAEVVTRAMLVGKVRKYLPDVLPDMSNFQNSLLRWGRRLDRRHDDESTNIIEWMRNPNPHDTYEDFVKKWVQDLMIQGAAAQYKEIGDHSGLLEAVHMLPGGSVTPLRERYVGGHKAYAQALPGMDPQIYFSDEIAYSQYMPNSGISYGMIPLEALVNKVAESLLFDQRAAEAADGTKAPEKMIVLGENSPFGDLTGDEAIQVPITQDEQTRLEVLMNEPRQNAVRVLTGYGTPMVVDLSRADTYQAQAERQKDIRTAVALVFNMSNMEINESGALRPRVRQAGQRRTATRPRRHPKVAAERQTGRVMDSAKITDATIGDLMNDVAEDLVDLFELLQEEINALVDKAAAEGWGHDKLIREINDLIEGDRPDQDGAKG